MADRKRKRKETKKEKKPYCQSTEHFTDIQDEIMRNENVSMRPNYNKDGLRQLAAAIGLQAVIDYKQASLGLPLSGNYMAGFPRKAIEKECMEFFDGDIFQYVVDGIPGEVIAKAVREAPLEQIRNVTFEPVLNPKQKGEKGHDQQHSHRRSDRTVAVEEVG